MREKKWRKRCRLVVMDPGLYYGDCLDLMQHIADNSIDLILCDLPYGKTRNIFDKKIDLNALWAQYERIIKPNGAIILFGDQPFTSELIMSNRKLFRYSLVWQKTNPTGHLNAKRMPLRYHEDILVFYKKLPVYNPQKTTGHTRKVSTAVHRRNSKLSTNYGFVNQNSYDSTERYPTSVLTFKSDKQTSKIHPTQKPVALMEYLIKTYSNPGDLVLDNCMGSGTMCLAAKNTGRRFIGIEKEKRFYLNAVQRVGEYIMEADLTL